MMLVLQEKYSKYPLGFHIGFRDYAHFHTAAYKSPTRPQTTSFAQPFYASTKTTYLFGAEVPNLDFQSNN